MLWNMIMVNKNIQPTKKTTVREQGKQHSADATGAVDKLQAPKDKRAQHAKPRKMAVKAKRAAIAPADDKITAAFHGIQEIYEVRNHDEAAAFTLSLARKLIECEAGSCMLTEADRYELYVSAAEGPVAEFMKGKKLSLADGIVGFATRTGSVVTVNDAPNDPRFNKEIDSRTGFSTRNVMCAPIQNKGPARGVLELVNSLSTKGFSQEDANVLAYLGNTLAEHIDTLPSRQRALSDRDFMRSQRPRVVKGHAKKTPQKKKSIAKATNHSSKPSATKKTARPKQHKGQ